MIPSQYQRPTLHALLALLVVGVVLCIPLPEVLQSVLLVPVWVARR